MSKENGSHIRRLGIAGALSMATAIVAGGCVFEKPTPSIPVFTSTPGTEMSSRTYLNVHDGVVENLVSPQQMSVIVANVFAEAVNKPDEDITAATIFAEIDSAYQLTDYVLGHEAEPMQALQYSQTGLPEHQGDGRAIAADRRQYAERLLAYMLDNRASGDPAFEEIAIHVIRLVAYNENIVSPDELRTYVDNFPELR